MSSWKGWQSDAIAYWTTGGLCSAARQIIRINRLTNHSCGYPQIVVSSSTTSYSLPVMKVHDEGQNLLCKPIGLQCLETREFLVDLYLCTVAYTSVIGEHGGKRPLGTSNVRMDLNL